jgi:hypothetical protein
MCPVRYEWQNGRSPYRGFSPARIFSNAGGLKPTLHNR